MAQKGRCSSEQKKSGTRKDLDKGERGRGARGTNYSSSRGSPTDLPPARARPTVRDATFIMDAPLESDDDDALSLTLEENAEDEEGDDPILEHNDDDDDDVMLEVNGSGDDEHGEDDDDDGLSLQLKLNEEVNAIEDHDAEAGIAGALRALCPTYDARAMTMGAAGEALVGSIGSLGMIVGAEGQLVDPQKEFLDTERSPKLEDAQALYPRKSGESDDSYLKRLTTLLTANEPLEAFRRGCGSTD